MSVKYAVSEEIWDRLWDEYFDSIGSRVGFNNWIRERIPYAEYVYGDEVVTINFKEEKDLTYFLLTL